jgi:hypothetical protein
MPNPITSASATPSGDRRRKANLRPPTLFLWLLSFATATIAAPYAARATSL